jgi:hypothetical protein
VQRHRPVALDVNLGGRAQRAIRSVLVFPDEEKEAPAVLRALDVAPPRRRIGTALFCVCQWKSSGLAGGRPASQLPK